MIYLLITIHVLICFFLIVVVLLQSGKAADLAGAFGGMGSQTAFGPRGAATVLSKATTVAAVAFMLTSISLSIIATRGGGASRSVLDAEKSSTKAPAKASSPAAPAPAPVIPGPASGNMPMNIELTPQGSQPGQKGDTIQLPIVPQKQSPAPAGKK